MNNIYTILLKSEKEFIEKMFKGKANIIDLRDVEPEGGFYTFNINYPDILDINPEVYVGMKSILHFWPSRRCCRGTMGNMTFIDKNTIEMVIAKEFIFGFPMQTLSTLDAEKFDTHLESFAMMFSEGCEYKLELKFNNTNNKMNFIGGVIISKNEGEVKNEINRIYKSHS